MKKKGGGGKGEGENSAGGGVVREGTANKTIDLPDLFLLLCGSPFFKQPRSCTQIRIGLCAC
jgi:hypothetical protein